MTSVARLEKWLMWQRLCKSQKEGYSQKPSLAISQDQMVPCKTGRVESWNMTHWEKDMHQSIKQSAVVHYQIV